MRFSPNEAEIIDCEVTRLLEKGVIEKSQIEKSPLTLSLFLTFSLGKRKMALIE